MPLQAEHYYLALSAVARFLGGVDHSVSETIIAYSNGEKSARRHKRGCGRPCKAVK